MILRQSIAWTAVRSFTNEVTANLRSQHPANAVIVLAALGWVLAATTLATEQASRYREARGEKIDAGPYIPSPTPNIPVRFRLDRPGYVTLVVEDAEGFRVRNLIQNTYFEGGFHTVYWDGYNEMSRTKHLPPTRHPEDTRRGPLHHTFRKRVVPGRYAVRGLVHAGIKLRYKLPVQSPGQPPWHTADRSGAWLSDHTPPNAVLFLPNGSPYGKEPQVLIAADLAEAGHSMMWLNLSGRKLAGGNLDGWQGAMALARDDGEQPNFAYHAYALGYRRNPKPAIVLYGLLAQPPEKTGGRTYKVLATSEVKSVPRLEYSKIDLTVRNGVALYTIPMEDRVVFVDVTKDRPRTIGSATVPNPRGAALDREGRLLLVSGSKILRYDAPDLVNAKLGRSTVLLRGLADPRRLALDPMGNLYVSDWGSSHQVKVFDPKGRRLRALGKPGGVQVGRYDERRMHHPLGFDIDSRDRLWVAELDYAPKRISLWDARTGRFRRAFYGPPRYGGGGYLDPRDKTRFYYYSGGQGIEFKLDWRTRSSRPVSIYSLHGHGMIGETPAMAIYVQGAAILDQLLREELPLLARQCRRVSL